MSFTKYCEITSSENDSILEKLRFFDAKNGGLKWAVQNKIDGCNLQICAENDGTIRVGSRSNFLGDASTFYNFDKALERDHILEKVKKFKHRLGSTTDEPCDIVFYGELAGGMYRNKEVEQIPNMKKIQGRISYAPFVFWTCFDIALVEKDKVTWLAPDTVEKICSELDIPFVGNLAILPLEEALAYNTDYNDTTGVDRFDLPPVDDNQTEGVVVKCMLPLRMDNGARPITKIKNDRFKERKVHKEKTAYQPGEEDQKWIDVFDSRLTEARVYSVYSKLTEDDKKEFNTVYRTFILDIWKDIEAEGWNQDEMKELEHYKTLIKMLNTKAATFIRPYFAKFRPA